MTAYEMRISDWSSALCSSDLRRDAEWMGQVYSFLGLTTGVIVPNLNEMQRREAYNSDITYATNNELGFDYLRDNMKFERKQMVHRPFNFGIGDEVDSKIGRASSRERVCQSL